MFCGEKTEGLSPGWKHPKPGLLGQMRRVPHPNPCLALAEGAPSREKGVVSKSCLGRGEAQMVSASACSPEENRSPVMEAEPAHSTLAASTQLPAPGQGALQSLRCWKVSGV